MPLNLILIIAALLFCLGLSLVLSRRNVLMVLLGIELMLNACNVNLVAFGSSAGNMEGELFALFIIAVAAAETAVALALIINLWRYMQTSNLDEFSKVK